MTLFEHRRKGPDHLLLTDMGVYFRFSRLREEHGEEVGVLRVYTIDYPGLPDRDLFVGKIILLGPRSKSDAARLCKDRCPTLPIWPDLIDDACKRILEITSEGDPWTDLAFGDVEVDAPWLADPLLRMDEAAILYGIGGAGKSTVGLALAMAISSGAGSMFGLKLTAVKQMVGYLDFEDTETTFKRRLRALAAGVGIPPPSVWYKRGEASLTASAEALSRQIADLGITGVIVDSAGMACGSDPEKSEGALAYWRAIRSLPINWSLTICHQPKDKENSAYPFGSIFWWNGCRMCWKLVSSPSSEGLGIGLVHRKANNGELHENLGYLFRREGERAMLEEKVPRRLVGLQEHLREPSAIPDVLAENGPMAARAVADAAGLSRAGIYKLLADHVAAGQIRKTRAGLYEFVEITNEFGIPGFD